MLSATGNCQLNSEIEFMGSPCLTAMEIYMSPAQREDTVESPNDAHSQTASLNFHGIADTKATVTTTRKNCLHEPRTLSFQIFWQCPRLFTRKLPPSCMVSVSVSPTITLCSPSSIKLVDNIRQCCAKFASRNGAPGEHIEASTSQP